MELSYGKLRIRYCIEVVRLWRDDFNVSHASLRDDRYDLGINRFAGTEEQLVFREERIQRRSHV